MRWDPGFPHVAANTDRDGRLITALLHYPSAIAAPPRQPGCARLGPRRQAPRSGVQVARSRGRGDQGLSVERELDDYAYHPKLMRVPPSRRTRVRGPDLRGRRERTEYAGGSTIEAVAPRVAAGTAARPKPAGLATRTRGASARDRPVDRGLEQSPRAVRALDAP